MSNDDSKFMRNVKGNSSRSREVNVTSVAVNPAYFKCIATGSLDGVVRLWDLKTSSLLERFEGHKDSVYSVSFSPDGKSLVSGSLDKTVKVWDLSPQSISHFERASLKGGSSFKPSIQEEPVEPAINQTPRKNFVGHTDFVLSVAFAGSSFISGRSYGQPEEGGSKVDDFSDVEWIISGSKDCSVIFWGGLSQSSSRREKSRQNGGDSSTRKLILQGHDNSGASASLPLLLILTQMRKVISVALASHSGIFATGSGDTHARIWRLSTVYNQKQNYLAPSNSYAHPPSQSEGDGPLFNFQNSQQQPNSSLPRSQSQNPKMSPQQSARPCPGSLPASSFHRRFGSAQADKNTHEMGDIDRNWGRKDMQYDIEPERSSADNEKST